MIERDDAAHRAVIERDDAARRAVMQVKSREVQGQGHANADVTFTVSDGGGTVHTAAQITGKVASMGEGVVTQDDVDRPVFKGNGSFDYVCASCGNVLAASIDPQFMTRRVRIRCGRCRTVNIAAENPSRRPAVVASDPDVRAGLTAIVYASTGRPGV